MSDFFGEKITLSPGEISEHEIYLTEAYGRNSDLAREKFAIGKSELKRRIIENNGETRIVESFSFNGSLVLSKDRLEMLDDGPLKTFIFTPSKNFRSRYLYMMEYGDQNYLRGESYYCPYDRKITPISRFDMISDSLMELMNIMGPIQDEVMSKKNLGLTEKFVYLTYLDHIKLELLRVYHSYSHLQTMKILDQSLSNEKSLLIKKSVQEIVGEYYSFLERQKPSEISLDFEGIHNIVSEISSVISSPDKNWADVVRSLPESDNPVENKIFAIMAARELNKKISKNSVLMGMHFGAVELPWVLLDEFHKTQSPIAFNTLTAHYSRYSRKGANIDNLWDITDHRVDTNQDLVIIDDGMHSGKSVEEVMSLAREAGFEKIKVVVEKLASERQLGRMKLSGGVNPNFIGNKTFGVIGISPFFRTKGTEGYQKLGQKGLFNIVSERVRKMITSAYPERLALKDIFKNLRR